MNDKYLDDYLKAYKKVTDIKPSRPLYDAVLALPDRDVGGTSLISDYVYAFMRTFDLFLPKAVGWALTLFLGVYLGLGTSEPGFNVAEDDFYLNDKAQFILSEDILTVEPVIEGVEK